MNICFTRNLMDSVIHNLTCYLTVKVIWFVAPRLLDKVRILYDGLFLSFPPCVLLSLNPCTLKTCRILFLSYLVHTAPVWLTFAQIFTWYLFIHRALSQLHIFLTLKYWFLFLVWTLHAGHVIASLTWFYYGLLT